MNNLKEFSLILDERNEKVVVPTKWLSEDNKILYWPPFDSRHDIKSAVIKKIEPDRSLWDEYPVGKLIKQYDDYVLAVSDSKMAGIEDMTDVSDVEKQKNSRSSRLKRATSPLPNEPKKIKTLSYSSDEDHALSTEASKKKNGTKGIKTFNYSSDKDPAENTEAQKNKNGTPRILENIPVQINFFKNTNASKSDQIMAQNQSKQTPCQIATETNAHESNKYVSENLIQNSEIGCLQDLMLKMIAMLGNVLEKQISLNMKIEKLENKVDRQKQSSGALTSRTLTIEEIKELEGFFPMKNVEEVSEVETKLKSEDKSFYRNLVSK
ncbi:hypothetical protein TKK_0019273 [Trichogramma kaykai]|uniref:Uncharacterized protein n=1 Tax=Trichogramma kaykai TaxID=54128 RepID=A0ABD2VTW4_9HYME